MITRFSISEREAGVAILSCFVCDNNGFSISLITLLAESGRRMYKKTRPENYRPAV
jgi:hypothetical protein